MAQKPDHQKALESGFKKATTSKLLVGVGSGWLAGMLTTRMGKFPTALVGTSIVAYQLTKIQTGSKKAVSDGKDPVGPPKAPKSFMEENPAFVAGFTGGFLIGLAC